MTMGDEPEGEMPLEGEDAAPAACQPVLAWRQTVVLVVGRPQSVAPYKPAAGAAPAPF